MKTGFDEYVTIAWERAVGSVFNREAQETMERFMAEMYSLSPGDIVSKPAKVDEAINRLFGEGGGNVLRQRFFEYASKPYGIGERNCSTLEDGITRLRALFVATNGSENGDATERSGRARSGKLKHLQPIAPLHGNQGV